VETPKKKSRKPKKTSKTGPKSGKSGPSRAGRAKKHFEHSIFLDWCKACGICSAFCPRGVIGNDETGKPIIEHPGACIGCRFCELHCPDFAISVKERDS
jgi:2-oxoglutarate ferredoxin oxidoreductase subunit delta